MGCPLGRIGRCLGRCLGCCLDCRLGRRLGRRQGRRLGRAARVAAACAEGIFVRLALQQNCSTVRLLRCRDSASKALWVEEAWAQACGSEALWTRTHSATVRTYSSINP